VCAAARHRWHRFTLAGEPWGVRFARLERGAGLVAWDEGTSIEVRRWERDGTLDAPQTVLTGIDPAFSGQNDVASWGFSSDLRGTVAIAAPASDGSIYATVRDPGGSFSAPQRLRGSIGASYPDDQPPLTVSPIAGDGTVTVAWSGGLVPPGQATRLGRATAFGAATPPVPRPAPDPRVLEVDGSRSVRLAADVRALCPCAAYLFTWGGVRRLALRPNGHGWYVARPGAGGAFTRPRLATRDAFSFPVWSARPGVLDFTREPEDHGGVLSLVPTTRPKLRPKVYLSTSVSVKNTLTIVAWCRATCRLTARIAGHARTVDAESLERPSSLKLPAPHGTTARIVLTARDYRGRTTRLVRTLRRGGRRGVARVWR
jgi:hypothetical protein